MATFIKQRLVDGTIERFHVLMCHDNAVTFDGLINLISYPEVSGAVAGSYNQDPERISVKRKITSREAWRSQSGRAPWNTQFAQLLITAGKSRESG